MGWDPNGITFANQSTVGISPFGIFVDIKNIIYVADQENNRIQVWIEESATPITTISSDFYSPAGLFVTINGDIYVSSALSNGIEKSTLNAVNSVPVMNADGQCFGLFVDINDNLYYSMSNRFVVLKHSLISSAETLAIVAGNGSDGSLSTMLSWPKGIYVDVNSDLYVADSGNNRIQLFRSGNLNGITLAGNGAPGTITLNDPTGVVPDIDGYLFIVDSGNHRIVGSGLNGFRCLVGCSGSTGTASNQLNYPWNVGFDSYGNMFVTNMRNNRIQKFLFKSDSCNESYK